MYLGTAGSDAPSWLFAGRVEFLAYERAIDEPTMLKCELLARC